ncbi:hypothetical protein [Clostridium perfringens]|uniref:hypothetical protein n=1 Tax=Clostridium perfringens TaxID=1502 RepID=UPI000D70DE77|nr:hypothetical protein [Clostridium perfringens]EIF2807873.1 hypothetical protein [Clostridium perfringens]ELC8310705.1 hypothetical protein [Clostridium perfringens]MBO3411128.1 hypothetical protein [Clostridium perfringens]MBO3433127.1 hypothetical protein [Clostridium perfringens]MDM0644703.1 hypothetical protein [Clostridium perfringens]
MKLLGDINLIISVIAGGFSLVASILSIKMFFLAKKEKEKCEEINNQINQKIEIFNKNSAISSKDKFNIDKVNHFDNRKSIN